LINNSNLNKINCNCQFSLIKQIIDPKSKKSKILIRKNLKRKAQSSKLKTTTQSAKLMKNNQNQQVKYRAYKFSIKIIKFVSNFPNKKIFWIISDQLVRAATSIGANIIEAQAASSRKDFIKFYEIALKSANETKYWLGLLRDATGIDKIDKKEINELLKETEEIAKILGASLLTLKGKR